MQLTTLKIEKPDDINFVLGQIHFVKTVEDVHESLGAECTGYQIWFCLLRSFGAMSCALDWHGQ